MLVNAGLTCCTYYIGDWYFFVARITAVHSRIFLKVDLLTDEISAHRESHPKSDFYRYVVYFVRNGSSGRIYSECTVLPFVVRLATLFQLECHLHVIPDVAVCGPTVAEHRLLHERAVANGVGAVGRGRERVRHKRSAHDRDAAAP
jgi:hypothetical protein